MNRSDEDAEFVANLKRQTDFYYPPLYYPPPYRPHLLPRAVAWTLLAISCAVFVGVCVLLMWVLSGFVN